MYSIVLNCAPVIVFCNFSKVLPVISACNSTLPITVTNLWCGHIRLEGRLLSFFFLKKGGYIMIIVISMVHAYVCFAKEGRCLIYSEGVFSFRSVCSLKQAAGAKEKKRKKKEKKVVYRGSSIHWAIPYSSIPGNRWRHIRFQCWFVTTIQKVEWSPPTFTSS
jgi:hypothetical protein